MAEGYELGSWMGAVLASVVMVVGGFVWAAAHSRRRDR